VNKLYNRGIPKTCLFFLYHGINNTQHQIPKYETVICANNLRDAIWNNTKPYGIRPAVSAVLFEMMLGVFMCLFFFYFCRSFLNHFKSVKKIGIEKEGAVITSTLKIPKRHHKLPKR
jgi:hypothetical protein